MKETIKAIAFFALGLLFYSKLLDKPEVQNVIKRLKQKKGSDNIMSVLQSEKPLGTITGSMTRKQVISIWKELKKQL